MTTSTQAADGRPLLIVVSSLSQTSREYFFQSVAPQYRLWLFIGGAGRTAEPTWELPYLAGYSPVDTLDPAAMTAAARALPEPPAGIVCYDEARIVATATVATALGLPTSPPAAVATCRDKWATRQALARAGVPQAESVAVRSLDEARTVGERLGYPVVLKPRNLAASFGVSRADSAAELAAAYQRARETTLPEAPEQFDDGVLVEEYLDGPEISIDAACFGGRVVPLVVARKQLGYPPAFEETGHVADAADPYYTDPAVADILARAHAAVGFGTGVTHIELRLTAAGPKVVEINGRLGGDLIPHIGHLATGVDPNLAAAAIACGREPDLTRSAPRVAAIRFYYPDEPVRIESVQLERGLLPAEVERAVVLADPGQEMWLPPVGSAWECRLAQIVAVADTEDGCRTALDAAGKAVVMVDPRPIGPLPDTVVHHGAVHRGSIPSGEEEPT